MSTFFHQERALANMTAEQRTQATLNAANHLKRQAEGDGFVLPLKHTEEHFVRWCFMVRHPWSAEPVRGVWFDCLRSRLFVEKYTFKPQLMQYKDATDLAVLGVSVGLTDGYAVGCMWGPPAFQDVAKPGTARDGWFDRRMPMMSYQGNLFSSTNVGTAPPASTVQLRLGSPISDTDFNTNRYLCAASITGNVGGGAAKATESYGTGPFYRGAKWATSTNSEGASYRALACGMKIWFLSSAQNRKGSITFLETSNHRNLDFNGASASPFVADVIANATSRSHYTGIRRYPLAGNVNGFHQVWHPLALADHQWLSSNLVDGPYANDNTAQGSEDMNYPAPGDGFVNASADPYGGYANPCFWIASGVDVNENVQCEFSLVYEMVNDINDGEDYSIMIDCAPRAAAKMCEQYSDAVAHHEGSSGAELRTTSEVATAELL